jgi:hypothetical protein
VAWPWSEWEREQERRDAEVTARFLGIRGRVGRIDARRGRRQTVDEQDADADFRFFEQNPHWPVDKTPESNRYERDRRRKAKPAGSAP